MANLLEELVARLAQEQAAEHVRQQQTLRKTAFEDSVKRNAAAEAVDAVRLFRGNRKKKKDEDASAGKKAIGFEGAGDKSSEQAKAKDANTIDVLNIAAQAAADAVRPIQDAGNLALNRPSPQLLNDDIIANAVASGINNVGSNLTERAGHFAGGPSIGQTLSTIGQGAQENAAGSIEASGPALSNVVSTIAGGLSNKRAQADRGVKNKIEKGASGIGNTVGGVNDIFQEGILQVFNPNFIGNKFTKGLLGRAQEGLFADRDRAKNFVDTLRTAAIHSGLVGESPVETGPEIDLNALMEAYNASITADPEATTIDALQGGSSVGETRTISGGVPIPEVLPPTVFPQDDGTEIEKLIAQLQENVPVERSKTRNFLNILAGIGQGLAGSGAQNFAQGLAAAGREANIKGQENRDRAAARKKQLSEIGLAGFDLNDRRKARNFKASTATDQAKRSANQLGITRGLNLQPNFRDGVLTSPNEDGSIDIKKLQGFSESGNLSDEIKLAKFEASQFDKRAINQPLNPTGNPAKDAVNRAGYNLVNEVPKWRALYLDQLQEIVNKLPDLEINTAQQIALANVISLIEQDPVLMQSLLAPEEIK